MIPWLGAECGVREVGSLRGPETCLSVMCGVGSRFVLLSLSEKFLSKGCVFVDYLPVRAHTKRMLEVGLA